MIRDSRCHKMLFNCAPFYLLLKDIFEHVATCTMKVRIEGIDVVVSRRNTRWLVVRTLAS